MSVLVNLLLASAIAVPAAPSASAPKEVPIQSFTPFSFIPGQYSLGIDLNSIKAEGRDFANLKILLDVEIIMMRPIKYIDSMMMVKSYQNSLSVDCANDRLTILVGRAFDLKGQQIYTSHAPLPVVNPHEELSPTTQVISLICGNVGKEVMPPKNSSKRSITV